MNKFFILGTLTLSLMLIGCGGNSNTNNQENNESNISIVQNQGNSQTTSTSEKLTPPTWIQGTWMDRSEPLLPNGWLFTADDMYAIVGENSVSTMANIQSGDTIEQTITEQLYSFTIHHTQLNSTESFKFNKLSDTKINFENNMGGTTGPFTKE